MILEEFGRKLVLLFAQTGKQVLVLGVRTQDIFFFGRFFAQFFVHGVPAAFKRQVAGRDAGVLFIELGQTRLAHLKGVAVGVLPRFFRRNLLGKTRGARLILGDFGTDPFRAGIALGHAGLFVVNVFLHQAHLKEERAGRFLGNILFVQPLAARVAQIGPQCADLRDLCAKRFFFFGQRLQFFFIADAGVFERLKIGAELLAKRLVCLAFGGDAVCLGRFGAL